MTPKVGDRFLNLLVTAIGEDDTGRVVYTCLCDCSSVVSVKSKKNLYKKTRKGTCLHCSRMRAIRSMPIGSIYGQLTVLDNTIRNKYGSSMAYCSCSCGGHITILISDLLTGRRHPRCAACGYKAGGRNRTRPLETTAFQRLLGGYRRRAKKNKHEWGLDTDTARTLFESDCFYCGDPPNQVSKSYRSKSGDCVYIYNGIDRIDNSHGYVPGNVVACCSKCNGAKSNLSLVIFLDMISRIYVRHCL